MCQTQWKIILVGAKPLIHAAVGLYFLLLGSSHWQYVSLRAFLAFLMIFRGNSITQVLVLQSGELLLGPLFLDQTIPVAIQ